MIGEDARDRMIDETEQSLYWHTKVTGVYKMGECTISKIQHVAMTLLDVSQLALEFFHS